MRLHKLIKNCFLVLFIFFSLPIYPVLAETTTYLVEETSIDRVQLAAQQINLLKNRLNQAQKELTNLQQQREGQLSQLALDKASKSLLDKAALDISVAKSNLESINIELSDSHQAASWLEKNIQEIENQLNVLNIFGLKVASSERAHIKEYRIDLNYQRKLLLLEKSKIKYLQELQNIASDILVFKKDKYNQLNNLLKSKHMLHIKQQQVKDELVYQQQQNHWLDQLDVLYSRLAKLDPAKDKTAYASLERDIFYANESANHAYIQSLIARYKDQIQQIRLTVLKTNSISLLNEISNQVQTLSKQINRLDNVLQSRINILDRHVGYLQSKKQHNEGIQLYLNNLGVIEKQYKVLATTLSKLNHNLSSFRKTVDESLQNELSSRQGFPSFSLKDFLDLGKELLLVPPLTFQITKSLSTHIIQSFQTASILMWSLFIFAESFVIFTFYFLRKFLSQLSEKSSNWRNQFNSRWLGLQCLRRNFIDLMIIGNVLGALFFFKVPLQNFLFIVYLSFVWLTFKGIMTISRLCLVETTHDTAGHDVKLYHRLKWIIGIGGIITALTVFVHQLPLIYELKTLCDRLFLFLLLIVSLLLLRSWDVVPNLILSQMETHHPYLKKSIRLIGILVPVLLFGNSIIGLIGFVNLIMTVSWYEGVFLIVLIGYLILRGLLSDGMEQLSRLMIQYVNNGWLLTEAFLKPIDKVLRIAFFLMAWAVLFLLYGWDKQSPIVARLTGLLHYHLFNLVNTIVTPLIIIELFVVISVSYWVAKWTREFVYRMLLSRTKDMGIRNSNCSTTNMNDITFKPINVNDISYA